MFARPREPTSRLPDAASSGSVCAPAPVGAALVARLQVEGVLLDVLDDVFLLHFPFETAQRALNGLAFLIFTSAKVNTFCKICVLPALRGRTTP